MNDPITDISKQRVALLYPGLRPVAEQVLESCFAFFKQPMNITQGMRSMDEQFHLYQLGRQLTDGTWRFVDPHKVVTNAMPGLSYHNYGLAFDCAFCGDDPYLEKKDALTRSQAWNDYGNIVKAHGLHWGGDFKLKNGAKDLPHAEMSYGLGIHECLELYSRGGIQSLWAHIDHMKGG